MLCIPLQRIVDTCRFAKQHIQIMKHWDIQTSISCIRSLGQTCLVFNLLGYCQSVDAVCDLELCNSEPRSMVGDLQRHCKGEGGSQHIAVLVPPEVENSKPSLVFYDTCVHIQRSSSWVAGTNAGRLAKRGGPFTPAFCSSSRSKNASTAS